MNAIDDVTTRIKDLILKQYDKISDGNVLVLPDNLSEEDLVAFKMDVAVTIVAAAILNQSTLNQINFLRRNNYLWI